MYWLVCQNILGKYSLIAESEYSESHGKIIGQLADRTKAQDLFYKLTRKSTPIVRSIRTANKKRLSISQLNAIVATI